MLFPAYQPSPYWIPYWIGRQHLTCQWSRTSICCHSMWFLVWSYLILRAIWAIHEANALREVLWQRVGKFLLKSTIALFQKDFTWVVDNDNRSLGAGRGQQKPISFKIKPESNYNPLFIVGDFNAQVLFFSLQSLDIAISYRVSVNPRHLNLLQCIWKH